MKSTRGIWREAAMVSPMSWAPASGARSDRRPAVSKVCARMRASLGVHGMRQSEHASRRYRVCVLASVADGANVSISPVFTRRAARTSSGSSL